ncbi:MAG: DNA-binding protein [Candidatus Micrarchaeota archaeon]
MSEDEESNELLRKQLIEQKKKEVMRSLLDSIAFERLQNIRVANPSLYEKIVQTILYLYQNNQIQGKISEGMFLKLVERLNESKETKISFRRK